MSIHTNNIDNYKIIYKNYFWKEIIENKAFDELNTLLNLIKILLSNDIKLWK